MPGTGWDDPLRGFVARPFEGVKLIAHCAPPLVERKLLRDSVSPGENV